MAIPAIAGLMASVVERFHAEAPHARLEWVSANSEAYPLVAEGVVDIGVDSDPRTCSVRVFIASLETGRRSPRRLVLRRRHANLGALHDDRVPAQAARGSCREHRTLTRTKRKPRASFR